MLQAGKSNPISFKVNVLGTSAAPSSVRVVLASTPELSYVARQSGDMYVADLAIPEDFPSTVDFRVEVVINNRLFKPIEKRLSIQSASSSAAKPASVEAPAQEKPVPVEVPASAAPSVTPNETIEMPKVQAKMPEVVPKQSIIKQFEAEKVSELTALQKAAKSPAKKKFVPISSCMPAGVHKTVTEKLKVRISDIDSLASKTFDKDLAESKSYKSPIKPVKVPVRKVSQPVKLVKGDITYE